MQRVDSFSGYFYSGNRDELKKEFQYFNTLIEPHLKKLKIFRPKVLLVPHAGYQYSGFSANIAYKIASSYKYKRVFVIGPSHKVGFGGISCAKFDTYATPLGVLKSSQIYHKYLIENFDIKQLYEAHNEHSTQTQFPFIKEYLPQVEVLEFVYGRYEYKKLSSIISYLLNDNENLVIISTDLSHFYTQKVANKLDAFCINAIANLDLKELDKGCEACGLLGVKAVIDAAKNIDLKSSILDYRTSGDITQDFNRVVGYLSAYMW